MRLSAIALGVVAALGCQGTDGDLLTPRAAVPAAKLIAHGQNMPTGAADLGELRRRIAPAEGLPFDGLVVDLGMRFAVLTSNPLEGARLQPAVDQLRATPFRKFTDNFQSLALGLPGADFDWGSDAFFAVAVTNMGAAARLVRDAGLRGFFMDNQVYGGRMWSYPDQPPGRSFADAQILVAARGEALMATVLDVFPDVSVLLAFGYGELFRAACIDGQPLEAHAHGLYPSFLDGMLRAVSGRNGPAMLVDAYLPAYPTRQPDDFAVFYNLIHFRWERLLALWHPGITTHWDDSPPDQKLQTWRATPQLVCDAETLARLGRDLPAGFGLMVDYGSPANFRLDPAGFPLNHFTPAGLEASLTGALRTTDRYVWLWQESFDWWGLTRLAAAPAPGAYIDAITRARQAAGRSGASR